MCVKTVSRGLLFPLLTMIPLLLVPAQAASGAAYREHRLVEVPGDLIDAEISGTGDVYLLLRGMPHLVVLAADGSRADHDLGEIVIPGGMCLDQGWGWFVTGEVADMVYRYDRTGVLMDSWAAAGLPGDIAISGLSVLYVSRADGTVRSVRDPEARPARLRGAGEGQLTSFGSRFLYSGPYESMILGEFNAPEPLPANGVWSSAGDELVVLQDSCIRARDGTELFRLPAGYDFSRISFSGGGAYCLLWSPGEERALVLR